jgi:RNA polymerase sigma-70 factor, ECF subfamily
MDRDLQAAGDANLVLRLARFEAPALAELYRRHGGAVLAVAYRTLWDRVAAEEAVQEVFVRLWNQPERFDQERGSLRSFLLAQSHGRAVDLLRSEGSRRAREERVARQAVEAGYDLEHQVADLIQAEQVREAVAGLPEEERRAIELAYFGGHTYREVARLLDQPEGTVKGRIRAGLRRMAGALGTVGALGAVAEGDRR